MLGQAGGHRRHHGRAFPTATLRQQESHVRVGHKAAHGLVESPGVSGGGVGEGFSLSASRGKNVLGRIDILKKMACTDTTFSQSEWSTSTLCIVVLTNTDTEYLKRSLQIIELLLNFVI